MRKVYIVLTHTGTILSRLIRLKTGAEYTHASISLDLGLHKMYSFGRLHPYIAFIGGFVKENKNFGTFKRFKKTQVSVLEIRVSNEDYQNMENKIKDFKQNREQYKFNILGLILAGLNKKAEAPNSFYCAEFVKYILEQGNVDLSDLPPVVKPEDFKKISDANLIYKGYLKDYNLEEINVVDILKKFKIPQVSEADLR